MKANIRWGLPYLPCHFINMFVFTKFLVVFNMSFSYLECILHGDNVVSYYTYCGDLIFIC